ncbi:hypothetical protein K438DRAFT_1487426, partial [Mycena galopus ATCC 62051]
PAWAENAKKTLSGDGRMGGDWDEVVALWWALEESFKFATSTKSHPTTNRPDAVGKWVKNARKGLPAIAADGFGKQWWAWWKGINPGWHLRDGELLQMENGSWDVLRCPGQNGFLNIVVCLKWWFLSMDTPSDSWAGAVADVKWV